MRAEETWLRVALCPRLGALLRAAHLAFALATDAWRFVGSGGDGKPTQNPRKTMGFALKKVDIIGDMNFLLVDDFVRGLDIAQHGGQCHNPFGESRSECRPASV